MNETKIKDEKKDNATALKTMKSEFLKERKSASVDNKFKEKLNLIAVKLAEDLSLKDKEVYLHSDIKNACIKKKKESVGNALE